MKQKEGQKFFFHEIFIKYVTKRILINAIVHREIHG